MLICIAWRARFPQTFTCYKAGVRCMSLLLLFESSFFLGFLFYPPRWLLPFTSVLTPRRLSPAPLLVRFFTLLTPYILTSNVEQAPRHRYWLSSHAKAHPDSLTTKFYCWLPRDGNFPPSSPCSSSSWWRLDGEKFWGETRRATWSVIIFSAKNSLATRFSYANELSECFEKS